MSEEVKHVPEPARIEIMAVYNKMQSSWKQFEAQRKLFSEMIRVTRQSLGIPSNELWDLSDDASTFTKIDDVPLMDMEIVSGDVQPEPTTEEQNG